MFFAKVNLQIFFTIVFILLLNNISYSQYTNAQIRNAISELQKKNLLSDLTYKTGQDNQQSATRADVIIACYQVVTALEKKDFASLEWRIRTLETVKTTPLSSDKKPQFGEDELKLKVLDWVNQSLDQMPVTEQLQEDTAKLKLVVLELGKRIENNTSVLVEVASIKRRTKQNTIIASVAIAASLVLSIISAR